MGPREIARSKDVTANSTEKVGKAGKVGPRPWEIELYIYKEEPRDGHGSSHDDPRLESALQSLSLHQDDFIPSDDDHGSGHPAFGLGATPDLHASASSASDSGDSGRRCTPQPPLVELRGRGSAPPTHDRQTSKQTGAYFGCATSTFALRTRTGKRTSRGARLLKPTSGERRLDSA